MQNHKNIVLFNTQEKTFNLVYQPTFTTVVAMDSENKLLTNAEILNLSKKLVGIESDSKYAEFLGVTRQHVSQFRSANGGQICHKMLSVCLAKINEDEVND